MSWHNGDGDGVGVTVADGPAAGRGNGNDPHQGVREYLRPGVKRACGASGGFVWGPETQLRPNCSGGGGGPKALPGWGHRLRVCRWVCRWAMVKLGASGPWRGAVRLGRLGASPTALPPSTAAEAAKASGPPWPPRQTHIAAATHIADSAHPPTHPPIRPHARTHAHPRSRAPPQRLPQNPSTLPVPRAADLRPRAVPCRGAPCAPPPARPTQRHYTLNIDGLSEVVGMGTWHHEANPQGVTVEMHGNIRWAVGQEAGGAWGQLPAQPTPPGAKQCVQYSGSVRRALPLGR